MLFSIFARPAAALSLGEIKVRSSFSEPFLAEISLPSYNADEMEGIEINLASTLQHQKMGYELSKTSKDLRFSVKENAKGALYIEVRSKSSINELSISFLLEVSSVKGRIIKGYAILLTPKAISQLLEKSEPIQAPKIKPKGLSFRTKNSRVHHASQANALDNSLYDNGPRKDKMLSKVKKLKGGGFEYRKIASGESLSRIAQRIRPRKSMHMYQVMVALYNENPNAFIDQNINNLKLGSSLKLQNIDAIESISKSEAFKRINQLANRKKTDMSETLTKTRSSTDTQQNPKEKLVENRLKITNSVEILSAKMVDEVHQAQINRVKVALNNANKMISELGLENKSLRERLTALESEINRTKQLLSLSTAKQTIATDQRATINADISSESGVSQWKPYQSSLTIAGASLFLLLLIMVRQRAKIIATIRGFTMSRNPQNRRKNMFDE